MPPIKVGIQVASLGLPFKKALEAASRMGADAVEIDARRGLRPDELTGTARRHMRKMLEDLRLSVCAIGFRTRRGYNVLEDLDRRVEATKSAMDFAYAMGAAVVVNAIGRIPEEPGGADWDLLVQTLTDIGRHAHRCGAFLAAETGSESGPTMLRLIEALPAGWIGVNLDPGNLVVNGFAVDEAVTALAGHVMHVHAKDGVRDLAQGRGLHVALGRGSVDFPQIMGTLEQVDYRGFYTIEREKSEHPVEEITAAVQYLRRL